MQSPPLPDIGPKQAFGEYLEKGEFRIQRCNDCEQHIFYPRIICPHCGSPKTQWISPTGGGTVYSCTTTRQKPEKGGDFNISLIDLDEGPRMLSRVQNISPEKIFIGMQVEAFVGEIDQVPVVLFRPVNTNDANEEH